MKRIPQHVLKEVDDLPVPSDMDERVRKAREDGSAVRSFSPPSRRKPVASLAVGLAGLALVVAIATSLFPSRRPSADGTMAAGTIEIRCSRRGPVLSNDHAIAGPNGISLLMTNPLTSPVSFSFGALQEVVPPGSQKATLPLPPGSTEVDCTSASIPRATYHAASLNVSDPEGYWMAESFSCPGPQVGTLADYGTRPLPEAPIDQARSDFLDAKPGDKFVKVQYSDPETAIVLIERDGTAIARFDYTRTSDSLWEFVGGLECAS